MRTSSSTWSPSSAASTGDRRRSVRASSPSALTSRVIRRPAPSGNPDEARMLSIAVAASSVMANTPKLPSDGDRSE